MAIVTVDTIDLATTPLYWIELDGTNELVKIILCTWTEKGGIANLVAGPWQSEAEARANLKLLFTTP